MGKMIVEFPEDCIRIRNILLKMGWDLNLYQVEEFWEERSEDWSAGWLDPPKQDEDLKTDIEEYTPILYRIRTDACQ